MSEPMNDAECNGLAISIYFLMVLSADSPLRRVGIVETGIAAWISWQRNHIRS